MQDTPLDATDLAWLSALARALVGDGASADDLAQDAAVAALEGPIPVGVPTRAWLRGVARRLAARRFRTDDRRGARERDAAMPESLPDSTDLVQRAEVAEQVTAAARRLPEPFRRAVLLRFLEGLTPDEIARRDDERVDTVRWRVRRGLELLREELVRGGGRDWSSWCVLLLPLARSGGGAGSAAVGASGALAGWAFGVGVVKALALAAAAALCGVLLWKATGTPSGEIQVAVVDRGAAPPSEGLGDAPSAPVDLAAVEPSLGGGRMVSTTPARDPGGRANAAPVDPAVDALVTGSVVDATGAPVGGATVYLLPIDASSGDDGAPVLGSVQAGASGRFRLTAGDLDGEAPADADLGVVANGYLRRVLPRALSRQPGGGWLIELERGGVVVGRVVDRDGAPVPDLEVIAFTRGGGIGHISPSQRRRSARRASLAVAGSSYHHCIARTDDQGRVEFRGLSSDDVELLSLDPGWSFDAPTRADVDGPFVEWTVARCLGVRIAVVDEATGRPLDRINVRVKVLLELSDGEVKDEGQWTGRGDGVASVSLDDTWIPGYGGRAIVKATFYGEVRVGGVRAPWKAQPIADAEGVRGVAQANVSLDLSGTAVEMAEAPDPAREGGPERARRPLATLELDVRYDDGAAFDGGIAVDWRSEADGAGTLEGDAMPTALGSGRFRIEVPVGDVGLRVSDRQSQGSYAPWEGVVRAETDRAGVAYVTLPRGATVRIERPDGFDGVWRTHASWRPTGEEEWRGSWTYGTGEDVLRLTALRPAEWRFRLFRSESGDDGRIVRTVVLEVGDDALVDSSLDRR
ncbi:MAG: sigma-70 family RNA polymerase sigma factor [Planctomycetota bacterium]